MSRIDYWKETLDQVRKIEVDPKARRLVAEELEQREQKLVEWFEENAPELMNDEQSPADAAIELLNFYIKGSTSGRS